MRWSNAKIVTTHNLAEKQWKILQDRIIPFRKYNGGRASLPLQRQASY
jgi:hypothetical protein